MVNSPLKIERLRRKLSGEAVAAEVGVSQATINRIENGKAKASPDLADRLAKYFGNSVTRDQILFPNDYTVRKAS